MVQIVEYKNRIEINPSNDEVVVIKNIPQYSDILEEVARRFEKSTFGLKIIREENLFDFINFSNTSKPLLVIIRGSGIITEDKMKRLDDLSCRKDLKIVYLSFDK